jgi:hypothetical protein
MLTSSHTFHKEMLITCIWNFILFSPRASPGHMLILNNQNTDNFYVALLVLKEIINLSRGIVVTGFHSPIWNNPLHNPAFVSLQFFIELLFWLKYWGNSTSILVFFLHLRSSFSVTFASHSISSLPNSCTHWSHVFFFWINAGPQRVQFCLVLRKSGCVTTFLIRLPSASASPWEVLSVRRSLISPLWNSSCYQSSATELLSFVTQRNLFVHLFTHSIHTEDSNAIHLLHFSSSAI